MSTARPGTDWPRTFGITALKLASRHTGFYTDWMCWGRRFPAGCQNSPWRMLSTWAHTCMLTAKIWILKGLAKWYTVVQECSIIRLSFHWSGPFAVCGKCGNKPDQMSGVKLICSFHLSFCHRGEVCREKKYPLQMAICDLTNTWWGKREGCGKEGKSYCDVNFRGYYTQ